MYNGVKAMIEAEKALGGGPKESAPVQANALVAPSI